MKHWFTTKHFLGEGTITACRNLPIAAYDSFTDLPNEVSCPHCVRHTPEHLTPKESLEGSRNRLAIGRDISEL